MNFVDFPVEIIREVVLFSPNAECFLNWLLVCKSVTSSISKKDQKKIKKQFETKTCDVWRYYNPTNRQTRAICSTREECIRQVRQEYPYTFPGEDFFEGDGYLSCGVFIGKVPLLGRKTKIIYVVQHPKCIAYSNERRACREEIEHEWFRNFTRAPAWTKNREEWTFEEREWMEKYFGKGELPRKIDWAEIWERNKNISFWKKNIEKVDPSRVHFP